MRRAARADEKDRNIIELWRFAQIYHIIIALNMVLPGFGFHQNPGEDSLPTRTATTASVSMPDIVGDLMAPRHQNTEATRAFVSDNVFPFSRVFLQKRFLC